MEIIAEEARAWMLELIVAAVAVGIATFGSHLRGIVTWIYYRFFGDDGSGSTIEDDELKNLLWHEADLEWDSTIKVTDAEYDLVDQEEMLRKYGREDWGLNPEVWDCDDFAFHGFGVLQRLVPGGAIGLVSGELKEGGHASIIIVDQDRNLKIFSPQTGEVTEVGEGWPAFESIDWVLF